MQDLPRTQAEKTSLMPPAIEPPFGASSELLPLKRLSVPKAPLPILKANFTSEKDTVWLYGNVTSTYEPLDEPLIGIYRYQLNSNQHNRQKIHIDMNLRGFYGNAGWHPDGYHIVEIDAENQVYTHHRYDLNTWERVHSKVGNYYSQFSSSAWDWVENKQAALCMSDSAWAIHDFAHFLDVENFERTKGHPIVIKNAMLRAIAIDTDGAIFAIDYRGNLYSLNRHNGALKLIGNTGKPSPYDTSMYIDPLTHKLYYIANDQATEMYILDTETAQATYLWTFPYKEQIFGLFSNSPLAYDGAPAAPENLEVSFNEASLEGTLSFRAPSKLFSGDNASGDLNYSIKIDRKTVATGKTRHGETVSVPVAVDTTGYHTYVAVLENSVGASPYAVKEAWTGQDYVLSVKAPELSYLGENRIHLEWDPCTGSQHGGFMPADEVVYDVIRYPGAVEVAKGIRSTEFNETINLESDEPMACYYAVRSNVRTAMGTYTKSNKITVGAANPPYEFKADNEADAMLFTVIDADNDGFTWQQYGARMVSYYNPYNFLDRDDWLISAPINVEKGMSYKVSLELNGHIPDSEHKFKLCGGFGPTAEQMTQTWIPTTTLEYDGSNPNRYETWITPDQDGIYYLGLHTSSEALSYYLYLNNMSISSGGTADAPSPIDDLLIYTHDDGGSKAYIGFTAPKTTLSGNPLASIDSITLYRGTNLVSRIENPEPGKKYELEELLKRTGAYEYTIRAYNAAGSSLAHTLKAYIGSTKPADVPSASAAFHADGTLISWKIPTTNVSGMPINPNHLTFSISKTNRDVVKKDLKGTEAVIPNEEGTQRFEQYILKAHAPGGESDLYTPTNMIPVGDPYNVPYCESVPEGDLSTLWRIYTLRGSATWGLAIDGGEINSSDEDGGFLVFQADQLNSEARLTGGRITLGEEDLAVYLDYFAFDDALNQIVIQFNDGEKWHDIATVDLWHGNDRQWNTIAVAIPDQFKGKTVQLGLLGRCLGDKQSYLDKFMIGPNQNDGITSASQDGSLSVRSANGHLYVYTDDNKTVDIFSTAGLKVASSTGSSTFRLPQGIYIVKCDNQAIKAIVR